MCITIFSTAHPEYPYIFLSNRDVILNRPTAQAHWWDQPDNHTLGGRDLLKAEHGTWLGVTRQGRLACLTNFSEPGDEVDGSKSRGAIVNAYLATSTDSSETPEGFVDRFISQVGIHNVGGFSLLFGQLRRPTDISTLPGLSIVSNRNTSADGLIKIAKKTGETHALSNGHFRDLTWPKVIQGEHFLTQAIEGNLARNDSEEKFIESLFDILSINTFNFPKDGEGWSDHVVRERRNSILIPPMSSIYDADSAYATQNSTVILVSKEGRLKYVERTRYDAEGLPLPPEKAERIFEFDIEGWGQ